MTYEFTQQWFAAGESLWPTLIEHLPSRKHFLEVGSFEGRSTVWTVENMMEDGGEIRCIDTWGGGEEHGSLDMNASEQRFFNNINILKEKFPKRKVKVHKMPSFDGLAHIISSELEPFDFIYIDGSHIARDVLTDACMAWPLLKNGGVMVFDDYMWGDVRDMLHRPKVAIDSFVNIFAEELNFMAIGYQLVVSKAYAR